MRRRVQPRPQVRGYTVMELVIASSVGAVLTLAAVSFATHQTKLYGLTAAELDLSQASRTGLDRLQADLRLAGSGIGSRLDGRFAGLELGSFTRGNAVFSSHNQPIRLGDEDLITDDLGILFASGPYATIANDPGAGRIELCAESGLEAGDLVLLRSEDGLFARSVRLGALTAVACTVGACARGCESASYQPDPSFESGPGASTARYTGGSALGGLSQITWFVDTSDPSRHGGRLRRALGPCSARDHTCGETILDGVESLQLRIWQRGDGDWEDRTATVDGLDGDAALRVDLELVLRASVSGGTTSPSEIVSELEPDRCFPRCGSRDGRVRRVVRSSVEIKNAGRVRYARVNP